MEYFIKISNGKTDNSFIKNLKGETLISTQVLEDNVIYPIFYCKKIPQI